MEGLALGGGVESEIDLGFGAIAGDENGEDALAIGGGFDFEGEVELALAIFGGAEAEIGGLDGDGEILGGGGGEIEDAEFDLLGEAGEAVDDVLPFWAIGSPVGGLEVTGDPDFGVARFIFDEVIEGGAEHGGEIGGGIGGGGKLEGLERGSAGEFEGLAEDIFDEGEVASGVLGGGLGEEGEGVGAFGFWGSLGVGFHAGGAIEEDEDGFWGTGGGGTEPATGEGSGEGPDEEEDGEHPRSEDEVLADFGASGGGAIGFAEEGHGGPRDRLIAQAIEEMDDHGEEDGGEGPKHPWLKKSHLLKESGRVGDRLG